MPETKQQTAMMILRDRLQKVIDIEPSGTIEVIIKQINTELLALEKQQHIDTGTNCIEKYIKGDLILGENIAKQYFNQTFNTK
jgi:hypothetical protein